MVKVCHVDIVKEQCRVYQKMVTSVLDKVSEQVSILNYEETPLQKEGEKKVIFTSLVTWSPLRKKDISGNDDLCRRETELGMMNLKKI